ncbi:PstS family phosphate ABC transporter substrate-binding protein [Argonema galeatum]|uniref:PstS family phosphate ABC transporter substrate-binding protein n=1 Tax=Argonema galeatum TaxID=2942762 RepID=UPI00201106E1|nr:phosphate ABC transporter substrate-binding protein [Argonema galeatum]MCL1464381.1 phosphate ABC transporter substrate-binding protein [Argonema galeatum A003/A1]
MSQKNETGVLVLALIITLGLVAGGFWWFTQSSAINIGGLGKQSPNASNSETPTGSNPGIKQSGQSNLEDFPQVQNIPSGLFNYGGSTSWAPIRLSVDSAVQAARPEFRLRYVEPVGNTPSSGTGIKMLLDGKLDFAQSSRPILDREYNQAQQRGFGLKQVAVAIDGLAVAVNPNLNIQGLTLDQLKSIYTGNVTNWKELGGPDLPIEPYSRPDGSGGTVEMFREDILRGENFSSRVEFVPTTTAALRKLATSPGGIYYASAPEVVPQCSIKSLPLGRKAGEWIPPYQEPFVPPSQCPTQRNQPNIEAFQQGTYPIARNLFVIIKQNGQVEQQAGEAYAKFLLTGQGQEMITKLGFVRIR